MIQLGNVEDSGRLGNAGHIEDTAQLLEGEDLLLGILTAGRPTQQRHIVEDGLSEITACLQILVAGIAMALGHLVLGVAHDGGAVDIGGNFPTKCLVQQIVLGSRGEILAAAHHMGDTHQMVIDDVGEVVGGQTVALQKHLIVQRGVFHSNIAEDSIVEGGAALCGDALTNDIGLTGGNAGLSLIKRQITAGIGSTLEVAAVLLGLALLAEAVVSAALFHQELGVLTVGIAALGLDVGGHRAANIGAFIVGEAALSHGAVDHIHSTFHQTTLIGVFNTQDESTVIGAGNEPSIQCRTEIAYVHITGGGRGETSTHLTTGNFFFHLGKIGHINSHFSCPPTA